MNPEPRLVEVRKNILKQNDLNARELRRRFHEAGVFVVSLVSSPGAGKTTLLEKTLAALHQRHRVAALVGDLATENDAARLAAAEHRCVRSRPAPYATSRRPWCSRASRAGSSTGSTSCSSRTWAISSAPRRTIWARASVSWRSRSPKARTSRCKYPTIFNTADIALITKIDLAEAVGFDRAAALASVQSVRPGMKVLEVSAKTGQGMTDLIELLEAGLTAARGGAVAGVSP